MGIRFRFGYLAFCFKSLKLNSRGINFTGPAEQIRINIGDTKDK